MQSLKWHTQPKPMAHTLNLTLEPATQLPQPSNLSDLSENLMWFNFLETLLSISYASKYMMIQKDCQVKKECTVREIYKGLSGGFKLPPHFLT